MKLTAYGLTAADVRAALAANDFLSAVGTTKGQMVQQILTATTGLHSLDEFRNLVVKQQNGAVVRLEDVAKVTLGAEDYETAVGFDGKPAVYIGIQVAPAANLLDVVAGVRAAFPAIQSQLPRGLDGEIVYDSTKFVNSSIHEVMKTLVEALIIVTLVMFAVPRLGALGGDPDDRDSAVADRHLRRHARARLHHQPADAARAGAGDRPGGGRRDHRGGKRQPPPRGGHGADAGGDRRARELGRPIIAMTVVLVAVYVPIGFLGGLTGALFTEFAFTLAGAVTDFRRGRADAVADDVLAPAETAPPERGWRRAWC